MKNTKSLRTVTLSGVIAALYVALTMAQELILPGSGSMAVQFRLSETLNVLCLFTPAAIPGLTVGCLIANLMSLGSLPFDVVFGSVATLLSAVLMWLFRGRRAGNLPVVPLLMPPIVNGIIIGAEIEIFLIKGDLNFVSFLTQAALVFVGEAAVCFTLGLALWKAISKRNLGRYFKQ